MAGETAMSKSCVTLRSHLLESPFSLKFSELSPWVFARTWTTAQNYPNYTNLLLKQHTSYQNITVTRSNCPGKAAHSGTKTAKYKTTKSTKNTWFNYGKILSWVLGSLNPTQGLLELQLLPVNYPPPNSSGNSVKLTVMGQQCTVWHRGGVVDWILRAQLACSVWIPYMNYMAHFP